MSELDLKTLEVADLNVLVNPYDLRRGIHVFTDYLRDYEIKRTVRGNCLPKADALRLAKRMADPGLAAEVERDGASLWIDYIDRIVLRLGFSDYATKGVYQGYSSTEESFPDNFMRFQENCYRAFLALPLQAQEERILQALVEDFDHHDNEFFVRGPLGRLDRFDSFGCATGVMPTLRFDKIRMDLLRLLAESTPGVWFSVESLVAELKRRRPFFLIPREIPRSVTYGRRRYHNFRGRHGNEWGPGVEISEKNPDAFEHVEGRYIERFLEGIPLAMGYTEVAYARNNPAGDVRPSIRELTAFRLTERFRLAMNGAIPEPTVTVLPNFEVHVDSPFYPASILHRVVGFSEVVVQDTRTIVQLNREKVAAFAAGNHDADPAATLQALGSRPLPSNVERELGAWVSHAEKFTIYEGFGLLEAADEEAVREADLVGLIEERIGPGKFIIRKPDECFDRLERAERMPVRMEHREGRLATVPAGTLSVFRAAPEPSPTAAREKPPALKRRVRISLEFPNWELLQAFSQALKEAGCTCAVDKQARTVAFAGQREGTVRATLQAFQRRHGVDVRDIE